MAELLTEYLRDTCGKKFEWGACSAHATDCYWWVIRWLEISRGRRAGALRTKYFGQYNTALGGWRLIYAVGGLEAALAEIGRALDLVEVTGRAPAPGAVAVVNQSAEPLLGIVATDARTAVLAPTGLAIIKCPLIRVWE